jgi:hypothetical protein
MMRRLIGLLMMVGLVVGVGCGRDSDSPTEPSEEITKWRKSFGDGVGYSVQQTVDGGFIVTGEDGNYDVLLFKTDVGGDEEWRKTFGESRGSGNSVQQTVDGGFIVTGSDDDVLLLLKADGQGNI